MDLGATHAILHNKALPFRKDGRIIGKECEQFLDCFQLRHYDFMRQPESVVPGGTGGDVPEFASSFATLCTALTWPE